MALPVLAVAGITAGLGALGNLLSGDGKPEHINYEDLVRLGYKPLDITKMVGDTLRYSEAMKKKALSQANTSARRSGLDPVAVNYSATEDIDTQTLNTIGQIEQKSEQEKVDIQNKLAMRNAEIDATPEEPIASKIIGGALQGGLLGLQGYNLMQKIKAGNIAGTPVGTSQTTSQTIGKVNLPPADSSTIENISPKRNQAGKVITPKLVPMDNSIGERFEALGGYNADKMAGSILGSMTLATGQPLEGQEEARRRLREALQKMSPDEIYRRLGQLTGINL